MPPSGVGPAAFGMLCEWTRSPVDTDSMFLERNKNEVLQFDAKSGHFLQKFAVEGEVCTQGRMIVAPCEP